MNSPPPPCVPRGGGLRDGLQSIARVLPTEHKLEWIRDAYAAGQREIEVGSFVPARLLPQLADTAELVAYAKTLPGLVASVLVPNLKGAQRAIDPAPMRCCCRCRRATRTAWPTCARRPTTWSPRSPHPRRARCAGSRALIEVGISTAFGCTIQGRVEPDEVLRLLRAVLDAGVDRVGLADTVGYADPGRWRGCSSARSRVAGDRLACGHFHDTARPRLANVFAAWQTGVRRFDACLGRHRRLPARAGRERQRRDRGPRLPVRQHGRSTGLDFDRLLALRAKVAGWLEGETLHGTLVARRPAEDDGATSRHAAAADERRREPARPCRSRCAGLRVVEFTHMVMGPTCGMVLADLGAEVIKVEPIDGDRTRRLLGAGAGFFPMFNRNKKSIGIDLHQPEGAAVARGWRQRRRGGRELQARHDGQVRPRLRALRRRNPR